MTTALTAADALAPPAGMEVPELWPRPPIVDDPPTTTPAPVAIQDTIEFPPLISYTQPRYSGLTSSVDIAARQAEANRVADAALRRSGMEGLTLRTAIQDAREALVGIPADLAAGRPASLGDLLLKNDRLRGLGVVAIVVGLVVLAAAS